MGPKPLFVTDTITEYGSYCQQLFFAFFHLPFIGLAGGMPTVSRGPVPLDSYRVSHINGFVKYFFRLFLTFFDFFWLTAERGMPGIDSLLPPGIYWILALPGTHGGGGWLYGVAGGWQAGRRVGRQAGGRRAAAGGSMGRRRVALWGGRRVAGRAGPLDSRLASLARVDLIYVRTHLGTPTHIGQAPRIYPEKS